MYILPKGGNWFSFKDSLIYIFRQSESLQGSIQTFNLAFMRRVILGWGHQWYIQSQIRVLDVFRGVERFDPLWKRRFFLTPVTFIKHYLCSKRSVNNVFNFSIGWNSNFKAKFLKSLHYERFLLLEIDKLIKFWTILKKIIFDPMGDHWIFSNKFC